MIDPKKPSSTDNYREGGVQAGSEGFCRTKGTPAGPQGPGSRDVPRTPLDRVRCRFSSASTSIWGERKAVSVLSCWPFRDGFPL